MTAVLDTKKIILDAPSIPSETLKEMSLFFQKTSIPRIIAEKNKFRKESNFNESDN